MTIDRAARRQSRFISRKIRKLRQEGYERDQAVAIAYSMARKQRERRARLSS